MSTAPEHTGAYERLALVLDSGSMHELNQAVVGGDPLAFPGYEEKLLAQRVKTEMLEAVVTAEGTIDGMRCVWEKTAPRRQRQIRSWYRLWRAFWASRWKAKMAANVFFRGRKDVCCFLSKKFLFHRKSYCIGVGFKVQFNHDV